MCARPLQTRYPNPFRATLNHALAALGGIFASEAAFKLWFDEVRLAVAEGAFPSQSAEILGAFVDAIDKRFVSKLLYNEDVGETAGIVSEAVMDAIHDIGDKPDIARFDFASSFANQLVNRVVRRINRSAKALQLADAFPVEEAQEAELNFQTPEPTTLKYLDDLVKRQLSRHRQPREVANPDIVMCVKNEWLAAINRVEQHHGATKARPFSSAVVEEIADRLGLSPNVVEAAMKRLVKALRLLDKRFTAVGDVPNPRQWIVPEAPVE